MLLFTSAIQHCWLARARVKSFLNFSVAYENSMLNSYIISRWRCLLSVISENYKQFYPLRIYENILYAPCALHLGVDPCPSAWDCLGKFLGSFPKETANPPLDTSVSSPKIKRMTCAHTSIKKTISDTTSVCFNDYFSLVTKYDFCLIPSTFLLEQTRRNVLGSVKLWLRAITSALLPSKLMFYSCPISVVLSLKYMLFFYLSKISCNTFT